MFPKLTESDIPGGRGFHWVPQADIYEVATSFTPFNLTFTEIANSLTSFKPTFTTLQPHLVPLNRHLRGCDLTYALYADLYEVVTSLTPFKPIFTRVATSFTTFKPTFPRLWLKRLPLDFSRCL